MNTNTPTPAIFLDRDGVIIENRVNYVRSWADVEIFPYALEALTDIAEGPYPIVIVTNQSAVGRGLITLQTAEMINTRLIKIIRQHGGRVDGVYLCPHAPQDGCNCRKPQPGLLLQAARELNLDLEGSIMIGDALTDLQAGRAAGVAQVALVLTGRGQEQSQKPEAASLAPFETFANLGAALKAWE